MPSTGRLAVVSPLARGRRPRALAVATATLIPLVGVVALGWNAAALVTLYWFELGIASFWAVVRGLFAGRPSEFEAGTLIADPLAARRISLSIPRTDAQIWLSSVLVLPVAAAVLAAVWAVVGTLTVGVVVDGGLAPDALDTVAPATIGLFAAEAAATVVEYGYRGGYREHSAQTAIRGVFAHGMAIFFGAIVIVTLVGAATVGTEAPLSAIDPDAVGLPVLCGVIALKLAVDLAGLYGDRLAAFDESSSLDLGFSYDPPEPEPVRDPLAERSRTIRLSPRGRVAGAVFTVGRHSGLWLLGGFPACVGLLFAIGREWATAAALGGVAVAVPVTVAAIDHELRYGLVEYRVGDDALVAYDRLFGTALWRIEPWDETDLRLVRTWLDRRLGTGTVVIDLGDRERQIPLLADPDPVLDVFDRRAMRPAN
ncbi:PH domain-containing protein [Halorubrum sp. SD626R]|uniref:DUF6498-containing protein n=1 Tax=Halorubrum sp. SD626R TaxID=1419722 RepID=UPI0010F576D8|nr:DUF6498-containing protein [Halorubrum sp. SD626R]TKX78524.1 PH domain-containing protein [Halorubrum sp. SD626R]